MEQSYVTKIRKGKIALPREVRTALGSDTVVFIRARDGLYLKPLTTPSLVSLQQKLKKAGTLLKEKDIASAVTSARRRTYAGRS